MRIVSTLRGVYHKAMIRVIIEVILFFTTGVCQCSKVTYLLKQ